MSLRAILKHSYSNMPLKTNYSLISTKTNLNTFNCFSTNLTILNTGANINFICIYIVKCIQNYTYRTVLY